MHLDLVDPYHHRSSVIHQLDPRVKVLLTLVFVLAVSLTPHGAWWAYAAFFILLLAATWAAKLRFGFALRRSVVVLPFALAALAIPFVTPGSAAFEVPLLGWTVSWAGLERFASILLRMWLAVQGAVLLTASTRFSDMLWGLRGLGFPQPLVGTIGFMYRYLYVLADEALRMMRARAARSPRKAQSPRPSLGWQGRVAGSMVGSLFLRSFERSDRVYAAMAARGYDGRLRSLASHQILAPDRYALTVGLLSLALILGLALVV